MKKRIISKILTLLVVFSMVFTLLPVNNKIVHAGDGKVNIGDYIYLGTYQGKKIKWGYLTMKVSSDFKSFHFADSNSRFDDVCVEDLWTNLNYYGVDKIYNGGIQTLKMKNRMAASAYQENDQNQTTIQISANKRFRLQNEEGKYLEYDGNNYTGDMKVYSCEQGDWESEHPIWNLRVAASNSFELTKAEEGCQLRGEICDG